MKQEYKKWNTFESSETTPKTNQVPFSELTSPNSESKHFYNQHSPLITPSPGEINNDPSETIPGQGYSVVELVAKYQRGQALGIKNRIPMYPDSEPSFDDIDPTLDPNFDLSDITIIEHDLLQKREARELAKAEREKIEALEKQSETQSKIQLSKAQTDNQASDK